MVTGTQDTELETLHLIIYPNPSKAGFHFHNSQAVDVQVLDLEGKLQEEHRAVSDMEIGKTLRQGVYFIKAEYKVYKVLKE